MPAPPSIAHATLSSNLSLKPYILSITPATPTPHLLLRHPSNAITIVDNQTLQPIELLQDSEGHKGDVTDIKVDEGGVWSSAKDSTVVRWDERSRRAGMVMKAFVRKPLPVLALAVSERDNLVIAGTELVSSEAHILFWDMRNTKTPAYSHTATHSDDITHLSLLPSTSTFLPSSTFPSRLLLSSSTDGLVALSDMKESDEDEAVQAAENWGQSIAGAGFWKDKRGKMKVWGRSDMDGVHVWVISRGPGEEGEVIELQNPVEYPTETFKFRNFNLPADHPSLARSAEEERQDKSTKLASDYLIDVIPSLGVGKRGGPMAAVGTNGGDIVLLHQSASSTGTYEPSGYLTTGPGPSRGHKDVIRCLHHDIANEALYTGSEDGVLSGWSLASLTSRLVIGDPEVDDDGGDGREDITSDDEEDEEESEIESDDEDDDGMDVDSEDEEIEDGPRNGPVIGIEKRKEERRKKRAHPY